MPAALREPSKLAARYLETLAATRGASPHTLRAYRADLAEFDAFLAGRGIDTASEIAPRALRAFLVALDERHSRTAATLRGAPFLKWLVTKAARNLAGRAARGGRLFRLLELAGSSVFSTRRTSRRPRPLSVLSGTRAAETVGASRGSRSRASRVRARDAERLAAPAGLRAPRCRTT
jgi:hypothetical protein